MCWLFTCGRMIPSDHWSVWTRRQSSWSQRRTPIPMKPGSPARHDYEYERHGVANLFMMFAPLEGWRQVKVTDRHTAIDYAHVLRDISDTHFADAKIITLL